ncbi:D-alanyl-D-alanine carboxypeptidase [Streptomyces sp. SM12]|uniref:D-alanyl-D-alanine carboxypeptidase n=1 Tax=Streptomyces sp. SM12 TaxID=1071602 RepID=UPI000CD5B4CD|nr:D-alanyl-D-alanine carboxypeptidase [Streptomyces sp. SM12]
MTGQGGAKGGDEATTTLCRSDLGPRDDSSDRTAVLRLAAKSEDADSGERERDADGGTMQLAGAGAGAAAEVGKARDDEGGDEDREQAEAVTSDGGERRDGDDSEDVVEVSAAAVARAAASGDAAEEPEQAEKTEKREQAEERTDSIAPEKAATDTEGGGDDTGDAEVAEAADDAGGAAEAADEGDEDVAEPEPQKPDAEPAATRKPEDDEPADAADDAVVPAVATKGDRAVAEAGKADSAKAADPETAPATEAEAEEEAETETKSEPEGDEPAAPPRPATPPPPSEPPSRAGKKPEPKPDPDAEPGPDAKSGPDSEPDGDDAEPTAPEKPVRDSTFVPLRDSGRSPTGTAVMGAVTAPPSAPPRATVEAPSVPDEVPAPTGPPPPVPDAQRDPLELLAELTNRQAPPPSPLRSALRRVKIWTPLVLLLVVLVGVAQILRPLPEPTLVITTAETHTFDGESPNVPWPEEGQAALDVDGVATFGTSGEQVPVPIASVTKTMTAYLILRDHPMGVDEDGEDIPVDQQAQDDYALGEDRGDSVVDVRAGDTITQREALQALMIASGNNVAWLLARWDSGDVETFVEKMNEAAAELGMDDTVYTDPSGFDLDSVSTAADQVKLGRAAMEDPVLRQVVGVSGYTDQYGESHPNGNPLVPVNGVVGIKTGSRTAAGGNFLFAARQDVDGESQLIVGAVLSQPPHPSDNSIRTGAVTAADALMTFAQQQLETEQVLSEGDVVGHVDDGMGGRTPLVVSEDVTAVGWPGLTVDIRLTDNGENGEDGGLRSDTPAGTVVGSLTVGDADGAVVEVPVTLQRAMEEPGIGAKLLRLG